MKQQFKMLQAKDLLNVVGGNDTSYWFWRSVERLWKDLVLCNNKVCS